MKLTQLKRNYDTRIYVQCRKTGNIKQAGSMAHLTEQTQKWVLTCRKFKMSDREFKITKHKEIQQYAIRQFK